MGDRWFVHVKVMVNVCVKYSGGFQITRLGNNLSVNKISTPLLRAYSGQNMLMILVKALTHLQPTEPW